MAIIDSKLLFGENVDVAGPSQVGDVIDLFAYGASGARDAIARGEPVWWVTLINDRGTGGTDLRFNLQNKQQLSDSGETFVWGREFAASELFTGLHFVTSLPVTNIVTPRYLRVTRYTTGTFSGTLVTSYLTASPPIFSNDNHVDWR